LAKIFEYYSCIKLTEESNNPFYEYSDIDPEFKEINNMSKNDTGIDACNLIDTIVQCKLRDKSLSLKECSTFFASQNIFCEKENKAIVKWEKLIITRNKDSVLSDNLKCKNKLFVDKTYDKQDMIKYCENLIKNPPIIKTTKEKVVIRDYQEKAIQLIKDMKNNLIINLPTGTGKNFIIAHALKPNKFSYLILVPRIILLEQIETEIIKYKPDYEKYIQKIGDGNNDYDEDKNITICVYNSVKIIDDNIKDFDYIIVDEAHHIAMPEIYKIDNDDYVEDNSDEDNSDEDNSDEDNSDEDNSDEDNSDDDNSDDDNSDDDNSDDDNSDEESCDNKTYLNIIKSYQKYKNNVYLSATIDELDNFDYYTKDIRVMIDNKYLSDYIITVPIFSDSPDNKNVCEYLIKNYRNIIIYCNSQKEGNAINKLMNSIQKNCSEYIDCETKKSDRNDIIEKYIKGELPFLVNVRILVEGFDAPITKGICFMHMPSSKTTLIQIIGRALRLHSDKKLANIILPFSSKSDEDNINKFLKVMARNDSRIRKSYIDKKVGGYINIIKDEENLNEEEENNIELRYELIFDKMGILKNSEEIWEKRLEELKLYIDKNGKRPSGNDKDNKIKQLGQWISHQINNYQKSIGVIKNYNIRKIWEEFINDAKYKQYFLSNEHEWLEILDKVKKYIDENGKKPSYKDKNKYIQKLCQWLGTQQKNYSKKRHILKNDNIRKIWQDFISDDKYKKYLLSNEEVWQNTLIEIKRYIDKNKHRPSHASKNKETKKIGKWISHQIESYQKKTGIMKNINIKYLWENFINDDKYKIYFISNEQDWQNKLNEVKKYMDENDKRPSSTDKNINIKIIGRWLTTQQKRYIQIDRIMKNKNIRKLWKKFINDDKYKKYFISPEQEWVNNLNKIKNYIDVHNKKPSSNDKNNEITTLYRWINTQNINYYKKQYNMKNQEIKKLWEEFINDPIYSKYFK
jgi:superfamily II DNA or RNA helicase